MDQSGRGSRPNFDSILEQGANVDSIFKDDPARPKLEQEKSPVEDAMRKLAAMEELFACVNADVSFEALTSLVLEIAMRTIPSEAGSFFEVDYKKDEIFFRAVSGKTSEGLLKITVPSGAGIVGAVCETGVARILSRDGESEHHLKSIGLIVGFQTRDVLAVPVMINDASFGCIELLNPTSDMIYTDKDQEVLALICSSVARIIETRLKFAAALRDAESAQYERKAA